MPHIWRIPWRLPWRLPVPIALLNGPHVQFSLIDGETWAQVKTRLGLIIGVKPEVRTSYCTLRLKLQRRVAVLKIHEQGQEIGDSITLRQTNGLKRQG